MLDKFFNPQSIAVVGASAVEGKVGYAVLKNILDAGFAGQVFPVNSKYPEIMGRPCYPRLLDIPHEIDLCVMVIPAPVVLETIDQCPQKNISAVVVISAGFKETGPEGALREKELSRKARQHNIRIIGPNCLGIINTHHKLNASFAADVPEPGNVAFISQSGALLTSIMDYALGQRLGFSKLVSLGNKADLGEVEMLEMLGDDPQTKVIIGYIEGIEKGQEFLQAASRVSRHKPIIILKAGTSEAGSRAVSSHTGSLAGVQKAFTAAFHKSRIIQAGSAEELINLALAFSYQPLPQSDRLALITNAGGPGILATDACQQFGVRLASFTNQTIEQLQQHLPPVAALYNPVDIIGDADAERYVHALSAVLSDPGVDGAIVILTPQQMTQIPETAEALVKQAQHLDKPVLASFMGQKRIEAGEAILRQNRIPNYLFPEKAVQAFAAMVKYEQDRQAAESAAPEFKVDKHLAQNVITENTAHGLDTLESNAALDVLSAYGFKLPERHMAKTCDEAMDMADKIGYPVALKIVSPDILHKTDIGGVKIWLRDANQVRQAFREIVVNTRRYMPDALILGVMLQPMVSSAREVILGLNRDPSFGHLLMFGLGGVYAEVFQDVSFRLCPVDPTEALSMIREIRSYPLLQGVRGEKPYDIAALVEAILRLSKLATDFPQIAEADINPLMVKPKSEGVIAVDARFRIQG